MEYLSSLLCQATRLAAEAHDGALRKGSRMPYLVHAMETAAIVASMTEDEDVLAAAVLHDVLEDTAVGEEALRATVGGHVTDLVRAVSEDKRPDRPPEETWRARKQESVERLLSERRLEVKMIALGDKLSNMRALQRDYNILGEEVWTRFHNPVKGRAGLVLPGGDRRTAGSEYLSGLARAGQPGVGSVLAGPRQRPAAPVPGPPPAAGAGYALVRAPGGRAGVFSRAAHKKKTSRPRRKESAWQDAMRFLCLV